MRDGPAAGLALVDDILARGELVDYRLAHAARGELCRRLGKTTPARCAYQRALALARQAPERRYLRATPARTPSMLTASPLTPRAKSATMREKQPQLHVRR